jgi:hypothetical protein
MSAFNQMPKTSPARMDSNDGHKQSSLIARIVAPGIADAQRLSSYPGRFASARRSLGCEALKSNQADCVQALVPKSFAATIFATSRAPSPTWPGSLAGFQFHLVA